MSSHILEGDAPSAPSRHPHFSSHRATGNTEEFQNFRVSAFPLRPPHPRVASLLRYAPVAPLGYTFVFPFGHALSRGCSLPLMSPFGLPCGRQPSQRPLACVRVNPPPRALLFILSSCLKILTLIRVGALTSPSVFEISSQFRHTPPSVHASARSVPPQIFQESS